MQTTYAYRTSNVMDEPSKFVNRVRNPDNEGITEATFDVKPSTFV